MEYKKNGALKKTKISNFKPNFKRFIKRMDPLEKFTWIMSFILASGLWFVLLYVASNK